MIFDQNSKNIAPLLLAHVRDGKIFYRPITMEKPYAQVGEDGVQYNGPTTSNENASHLQIAIFGPNAEAAANSPAVLEALRALNTGQNISR